ncbi:MAG: lytic transglycosylase domain-containing protein [Bacillota bacterium]
MVKNRRNVAVILLLVLLAVFLINPKQIGRHYYPLKHKETIFRYAAENNLNPLLVTAIVKVESGFRHDAVSPRGAVGLMQLMPQTAAWIAAKQGQEFSSAQLLDPERNICFGAWYMAFLKQEFNSTVLALAAYNAGRGNVKKWLSNRTWTGEAADIDQIPFPETRQFVRKTIWTYRIYLYLYPENKSDVRRPTSEARRHPAQRRLI